ncbi:MAG: type 4a pilus biogenesis protein PilO [Candidatus Sungbacteria bacterium]|nr:type 4a pilus biogenesis protein PilO [Candidatus Sungbacteria bacterium]
MVRLITASVFLLAALGIGFFYTLPEWRRFQGLGTEITQLEAAGAELDSLVANRDNLLNLINGITKEDLDRVDQILPQGARASDFLVAMEALTGVAGMELQRIDLVSPQKTSATVPGNPQASLPRAAVGGQDGAAVLEGGREKEGDIPGVRTLPFTVEVSGSYENFKKFLTALEKNLRLIDIEQIQFTASGESGAVDFTLKAKTYYY